MSVRKLTNNQRLLIGGSTSYEIEYVLDVWMVGLSIFVEIYIQCIFDKVNSNNWQLYVDKILSISWKWV
jgi:hypothetical protein